MGKNAVIGVFIILALVIGGILLTSQSRKDADKQEEDHMMEEGSGMMVEGSSKATLSDVSGGEGSGTASASFAGDTYTLEATFANIPDPEGTDFYEGWVVRKEPLSAVSTGRVEKNEAGVYVNTFSSAQDLTDHTQYVLTLEPDDGDPAPAAHILAGDFVPADGGGAAENGEEAAPDVVIELTGRNFEFSQDEIRVQRGQRVRIVFESELGFHDWVVDEFSAATERVQTGESASVEFVADETGTFEYYCSVGNHRAQGMVGSLIVE